ncbi:hypothetical protein [Steroidobacter sp.]|uniref:hypothetical protein n=1 Tax=Steroidobacter sp. TaxID=1978227 RepID=UPI001A3CBF94|nr:hypothetical protein [Steroidobacter sp.]MBL8267102.1 hypothetical protein [Steroidobacter sp.]
MTRKSRIPCALAVAAAASLLVACGSAPKPPPPVEETAFKDMAGAMDKARAVEGTMQQHKEDLDRTLQQNENPTTAE